VRSTELHTSLQRKVQPWQMQRLILALQQLSVDAVRVNASNRSNTRTNGEQIMIMFANRWHIPIFRDVRSKCQDLWGPWRHVLIHPLPGCHELTHECTQKPFEFPKKNGPYWTNMENHKTWHFLDKPIFGIFPWSPIDVFQKLMQIATLLYCCLSYPSACGYLSWLSHASPALTWKGRGWEPGATAGAAAGWFSDVLRCSPRILENFGDDYRIY